MKNKGKVYKSLALITQFGLNIMVPTFICLFIGIWVGKLVGAWIVIPFIFLGMAAGMRNCYLCAMSVSENDMKEGKAKDGQHDDNN